jgi:hypothetical protein
LPDPPDGQKSPPDLRLENFSILLVSSHHSNKFAFVEQILSDEHVSAMEQFGIRDTDVLIDFAHQVVYDQQHPHSTIRNSKSLFGQGSYHAVGVFEQSKHEPRFAQGRRPRHGKRVFQQHVHDGVFHLHYKVLYQHDKV